MKPLFIIILYNLCFCGFTPKTEAQTVDTPWLAPIQPVKVPVTLNKMTSLVFPSGIRAGIRVSKDIMVQRVKGVENALELKATRRHFPATNLSVYGLDGQLYSFDLEYADDPTVLSFVVQGRPSTFNGQNRAAPIQLTGLPINRQRLISDAHRLEGQRPFMGHSMHKEGMILTLRGIYLTDGLLWMTFLVSNKTSLPYPVEFIRLYTEDRRRIRRRADQQTSIDPIYQNLPPLIPGQSSQTFSIALPLLTVGADRRLVCELEERNGSRLLRLNLNSKILLKARN